MPEYTPISVIIPCFNEEKNLHDCLESVKWADEIIIVDSFSTDKSLDIAGRYTDRILRRAYKNHADQLNWAIPQAKFDWVMVVDCDERIPPELIREIRALNLSQSNVDGYRIVRSNHLFGKKMRYSGWGRDSVLRLFRKDKGRKKIKRVHSDFQVPKEAPLKGEILHYPMPSMEIWLEKINRYTTWKALDKMEKPGISPVIHLFTRPPLRFFKDSILRLGILDGWRGILVAAMSAFAEMVMSAKMMQIYIQKDRLKK